MAQTVFEQVDVEKVDLSTTMLGTKVDAPFYVTATALSVHPKDLAQETFADRGKQWETWKPRG